MNCLWQPRTFVRALPFASIRRGKVAVPGGGERGLASVRHQLGIGLPAVLSDPHGIPRTRPWQLNQGAGSGHLNRVILHLRSSRPRSWVRGLVSRRPTTRGSRCRSAGHHQLVVARVGITAGGAGGGVAACGVAAGVGAGALHAVRRRPAVIAGSETFDGRSKVRVVLLPSPLSPLRAVGNPGNAARRGARA